MFKTSFEEFNQWLVQKESAHLEFKLAQNNFDRKRDLPDYCAALANEGGGKLILGVENKSRKVVGTKAFLGTHEKLAHELYREINHRIEVEEFKHPDGRVLIFHIPSRPVGHAVSSPGSHRYPMRIGESLTEMDVATLKKILNETAPDFSSQIVAGSSVDFLDSKAIERLKRIWSEKSQRPDFMRNPDTQMLKDFDLLSDRGINYAALILLGKKEKITDLSPDAEIIFEWRQSSEKTAYDYRKIWRAPFLEIYDEIWQTVNARNLRIPFQDGLIQWEIPAFDEKSVREAIMNAVAHRDYTIKGSSIFIKASPETFIVESPGGFMPGINPENALDKKAWRNRRLAETLEKARLVERSGQGLNDIFEKTIRDGKGLPVLYGDDFIVRLKIPAQIRDPKFISFLEKIMKEKQISFSFDEIYALERVRENGTIERLEFKNRLLDLGIVEKVGRGRGTKYILSHRYYASVGRVGLHTRLRGLSRDERKQLILKHLQKNEQGTLAEFQEAFEDLKPMDISNLLRELKMEGKIVHAGSPRSGFWRLV